VGSRNKQRPTFEKRQREIARQERQAEKRARRQARADGLIPPDDEFSEVEFDEYGEPIASAAESTMTPGAAEAEAADAGDAGDMHSERI